MMRDVNCIILAGGMSSRMTFDKELIKIGDTFLIYETIEKLKTIFEDILVVSNNKEHYENLGVRVCRDLFYRSGPMAGLHSGLFHSKSEYSFLIACDMPNIDVEFIKFLINEIDDTYDGVVCVIDEKIMPMYAIYKNSIEEKLKRDLKNGLNKFRFFIEKNNFKIIYFNKILEKFNSNIFRNLNRPEELDSFKFDKLCKKL